MPSASRMGTLNAPPLLPLRVIPDSHWYKSIDPRDCRQLATSFLPLVSHSKVVV